MTRFTILMLRNLLLAAGLLWAPIGTAQTVTDDNGDAELTEEQVAELQAYAAEADAFNAALTPVFDEVNLPSAGAKLVLGDDFYYLKSADSRKVLEEAWGNPPDKTILGMIFPKGADAFYNDYAVAVTFEKSGYVSDEDAQDIDFDQLLKQMKKETAAGSKARVEQGYSGVELVGWATPPSYDAVNKRLFGRNLSVFQTVKTSR